MEAQGNKKKMKLKKIKISHDFSQTLPNPYKIKECYEYYRYTRLLDRDIVVNSHNELVDGYVAYLIAKMLGMDKVEVAYVQ